MFSFDAKTVSKVIFNKYLGCFVRLENLVVPGQLNYCQLNHFNNGKFWSTPWTIRRTFKTYAWNTRYFCRVGRPLLPPHTATANSHFFRFKRCVHPYCNWWMKACEGKADLAYLTWYCFSFLYAHNICADFMYLFKSKIWLLLVVVFVAYSVHIMSVVKINRFHIGDGSCCPQVSRMLLFFACFQFSSVSAIFHTTCGLLLNFCWITRIKAKWTFTIKPTLSTWAD